MQRQFKKYLVCFALAFLVLPGCARENAAPNAPALPQTWYRLPENGGPGKGPEKTPETPTPASEASVQTQFTAHTQALEHLLENKNDLLLPFADIGPKDFVPWHLDGMIAEFATSIGGVFGALAGGGTCNFKGTWQQQPPSKGQKSLTITREHRNHVRVKSNMTVDGVVASLEPFIQMASSSKTGSAKIDPSIKKNLRTNASKFLLLAKVLDGLPPSRGWHVDSLQQQLTLQAGGTVATGLGIQGEVNLFMDWQKTDGPSPGAVHTGALFESVADFEQSLSALIPEALLESRDIKAAGLALDQFQVGVAVLANGTIGIVQAGGEFQSKIIFKSNSTTESAPPTAEIKSISYISSATDGDRARLAKELGVKSSDPAGGFVAYQVPLDGFRDGMKHAIQMAGFFIKNAQQADTANWKISQVETEFDGSIGGQIGLATLEGQGQFLLDFDRPGSGL